MKNLIKRNFKLLFSYRRKDNFLGKLLLFTYNVLKSVDRKIANNENKFVARSYIRAKNIERKVRGGCTFVTIDEVITWTNEWIKSFPRDYDIIVGVPRSGLLVANMIALKLAKPLSTPELLREGKYWVSENKKEMDKKKDRNEVLLVDICMRRKETIEKPLNILRSSDNNMNITTASLLISKEAVGYVDLYYKVLRNYPPMGEWNLLHRKRGTVAFDMDGVICEDCPSDIDLNESLYIEWIKNARPYLIPVYKIDYIISNRLEKYRPETEEWLRRHDVKYDKLILWDIESKKDRKDLFAEYKADKLLSLKPSVYFESSYQQAKQIWESTRIPTICIDEMIAFGPIEK